MVRPLLKFQPMKLIKLGWLVVLAATLSFTRPARADDINAGAYASPIAGPVAGLYIFGTLADVGLLVGDVAARPTSHAYGWFEVGVNVVPLFVDGVLIADEGGRGEPLLYGVTAIHVLTMGHGLYTILTDREPPALTFNRGSVRGKVAATAVSDGKLTAPGLGVVGTF